MKHRRTIQTVDNLSQFLEWAVEDYNNRPHGALNGLTPNEVVNGASATEVSYRNEMKQARNQRVVENQVKRCPTCT